MDIDNARAKKFANFYSLPIYSSIEELLNDDRIDIVVNLTNPKSHFVVSKACLSAGKHVYSEKPLAMRYDHAKQLVELAQSRDLFISAAPCSVLGESAQTLWKAIKNEKVGKVRLVYAEMDEGPIHLMNTGKWISKSGTPFPSKDEYEVGCTLEHAGYLVTWLTAFFGPAKSVTSYCTCLVPDKGVAVDIITPDFSVACIHFTSGVVARLTCSNFAPHDHSLKIIGDTGILSLDEFWNYGNPVRLQKYSNIGLRADKYTFIRNNWLARKIFKLESTKLPFVKNPDRGHLYNKYYMDFSRGIAELAGAIDAGRSPRLAADFSLHVNEIVLAMQNHSKDQRTYKMESTFHAMEPLFF